MSVDISNLISILVATTSSPANVPEIQRLELIRTCEALKDALENPFEKTLRWLFAPGQAIVLRIAIDMKLFDVAATISAEKKTIQINELASKIAADALLVARIMRVLAAMQVFRETAASTYILMPLASAYVSGSPLADAVVHFTVPMEVVSRLPTYFAETGYQTPGDPFDGPFQYARNTKLHCFEWLAQHPREQEAFNAVMTAFRNQRGPQWLEFFPIDEKLQVADPSRPVLVDVGGGVGHDLIDLKQKYPQLQGKLIVQDLQVVVDSIKGLPDGIEAMAHDFFAPQPVRGAKAYFLNNVLHDWPDKQSAQILESIAVAMGPDSLLLVCENVVPETGVPLHSAMVDLNMMANFSSLERTLAQFQSLFERAGLQVEKTWAPGNIANGGRVILEVIPLKV